MSIKVCPPSYTAEECALCRSDNPACWAPGRSVPEPDVFALLAIGAIVAWVVKRLRG